MNHLLSALTAIRRSPYQALAAILILSITFFVGYSFSLFAYSTEHILHYFETRPKVTAFFNRTASDDQIQAVLQTMKSKPYVSDITVIDKQKALEIYRDYSKDNPKSMQLITADIFPVTIEVAAISPSQLSQIKDDLSKSDGIAQVSYLQSVVDALNKWTTSLRYIGITAVTILSITSFLIIFIISGMKVALKKRAIHIMRILGASKWYVKAPFVYEGILYGISGSLLGWGAMYVGLLYVTPWLQDFLGASVPLLPFPPQLLLIQLGAGTGLGIILGAFASSVAVQRMMRRS